MGGPVYFTPMQIEEILRHLPVLFCAAFLAILFIQSGLDKVFDWKGNLEWLTGHFSNTFLAPVVPVMLATITLLETLTGVLAAAGALYLLIEGNSIVIFAAAVLGAASITALFMGQRIAKDYAGAAILVPYFILMLAAMYLTLPGVIK